jgi:hypothetical protein
MFRILLRINTAIFHLQGKIVVFCIGDTIRFLLDRKIIFNFQGPIFNLLIN